MLLRVWKSRVFSPWFRLRSQVQPLSVLPLTPATSERSLEYWLISGTKPSG